MAENYDLWVKYLLTHINTDYFDIKRYLEKKLKKKEKKKKKSKK